LVVLLVLAGACGSHVESSGKGVDLLLAMERDPQSAVLAAAHPTYRATYETRLGSSFQPQPQPASPSPAFNVTGSQTYVARPPDFRWDFSYAGPLQMSVSAVLRGQNAHLCLTTPTPACYAVPPEYAQETLAAVNASPLDQLRAQTKDMDVTVLPRERIAGREGACFRWKPRAGPPPSSAFGDLADLSLEGCFSAEGIMLRSLTQAGLFFTMEARATSIADKVSDADLVLPYPITTAPFPIETAIPRPTEKPRPTN
jgi:hypothetical protein